MLVVVDHDVPQAASRVLVDRGHDVQLVRDLLGQGAADRDIASLVNVRQAVVMTCNKRHFRNLLPSVTAPGERRGFPKASVIFLTCPQPRAAARLAEFLDEIETEYRKSRERGDNRFSVEVGTNFFRIGR